MAQHICAKSGLHPVVAASFRNSWPLPQEWRIRADRRRLEDDIVLTAARLIAGDARVKK
jgi:hypothetical protein